MCPKQGLESCQQHFLAQRERQNYIRLAEKWVLPVASTKELEEREFVVDSGACMHMVSKKDINSAELETMRISRNPTTVMTDNGEVQTREEATVYVKELDLLMTVKLLEDTPAVLSLGKLCEDHLYSYEWTSGQKPQLIKDGRRKKCSTENYVPIVVLSLSTSSSSTATPTSPTSVLQESVVPTLHPTSTRSESTTSTVRVSPSHEQKSTKQNNKNGDNETVRRSPLRDLSEWLEEFKENLVDESVPAQRDVPASSSRESAPEPRGRVEKGKHSIILTSLKTEIAICA